MARHSRFRSTLPVGLRRGRADPAYQIPDNRARRDVAGAFGLLGLLTYTPFGRIIRAGSRDAEMVGLLEINLPVVFAFVFGIGCLLAGLAGMLAAPLWTVNPTMAAGAIMPAFVIVTIGGLGS